MSDLKGLEKRIEKNEKKIEKDVLKYLKKSNTNYLLVAYKLLFKYKTTPKNYNDLLKRLYVSFPFKIVSYHDKYINTLDSNLVDNIILYEGENFTFINNYMRRGKINISDIGFELTEDVILNDIKYDGDVDDYADSLSLYNDNGNKEHIKEFKKHAKKRIIKIITNLKKTIMNAPRIKKSVYVYRGERNYKPTFEKPTKCVKGSSIEHSLTHIDLKPGVSYDENSFSSFSFAPWIAVDFNRTQQCCMYRLKITPETPSLAITRHNQSEHNTNEYELLLPPATFKITKVHKIVSDVSPSYFVKVYDLEFVKAL